MAGTQTVGGAASDSGSYRLGLWGRGGLVESGSSFHLLIHGSLPVRKAVAAADGPTEMVDYRTSLDA